MASVTKGSASIEIEWSGQTPNYYCRARQHPASAVSAHHDMPMSPPFKEATRIEDRDIIPWRATDGVLAAHQTNLLLNRVNRHAAKDGG
jgi:hypothetical protein